MEVFLTLKWIIPFIEQHFLLISVFILLFFNLSWVFLPVTEASFEVFLAIKDGKLSLFITGLHVFKDKRLTCTIYLIFSRKHVVADLHHHRTHIYMHTAVTCIAITGEVPILITYCNYFVLACVLWEQSHPHGPLPESKFTGFFVTWQEYISKKKNMALTICGTVCA